jgi:penicillin-binding protein 1A
MAAFPFGPQFWRARPKLTRWTLISGLFALSFAIGLAWSSWSLVCREGACPDPTRLDAFQPRQTSKLFAADGRFIAELGLERRTLIKLNDIPKQVQQAFIITEDKRFYEHAGIDWTRVFGALAADIVHRNFAQGFSTLTMQLARNIFSDRISREKTMTRKLKEAKVARQIEARYPKEKILELYLNQIYLGNGAYGVETAAQHYFGKSVRELNLAEAATLAALPKGPERYNPRKYPDRTIQRRNTIIGLMRNEGVISDADARLAQAYPLQLARKAESGELAPYFVEFVRRQLEQQFGDKIYTDGLKVYTTLDIEMQQAAERNLERQIKAIESGKYGTFKHTTFEEYVARNANGENEANAVPNSPYLQGAVISMDPRNGAIRALIGGRDYDDSKFDRATQALRQPGSTFKPIVYSAALDNGMTPASIIIDGPFCANQGTPQQKCFRNFGGAAGSGPHTMRWGIEQSRNLMTVRTANQIGMNNVVRRAHQMGVGDYPPFLAIALGAGDTTVARMVNAFSTFANQGRALNQSLIDYIQDRSGHVIWRADTRPCDGCNAPDWNGRPMPRPPLRTRQVVDPMTAFQIVHILEGVVQRGTATILRDLGRPLFGKTGTTSGPTNVWFVGGSQQVVAGVYMGFDRPRPMGGYAQGGTLAAPIFRQFARTAFDGMPILPFRAPQGIRMVPIDRASGQRVFGIWPNDSDPHAAVIWEAFKPESEPRRTTGRDTIDLAAAARQARPTAPAADRRDSDFLQRQGGIY